VAANCGFKSRGDPLVDPKSFEMRIAAIARSCPLAWDFGGLLALQVVVSIHLYN
jgi:hypothetical protein